MNRLSLLVALLIQIGNIHGFGTNSCPRRRLQTTGWGQHPLQRRPRVPTHQASIADVALAGNLADSAFSAMENQATQPQREAAPSSWSSNDHPIAELSRLLLDPSKSITEDKNITGMIPVVLQSWSKKETIEGAKTVQNILDRLEKEEGTILNCGHYTIAVDAWAKSGHSSSAQLADAIVERMKSRGIRLNRVTYNAWMNAHAIQRDVRRVEAILNLMEADIPDEINVNDYNILISAHGRLGQAEEAEGIVRRMLDRYNEDGRVSCRPDLMSYNTVLDAWSKSDQEGSPGRGARAEMILDAIEERQDWLYTPDQRTYVPAMCAVIRSGEDNVIERVEAIRQRAVARGIAQDAYVYSTLLVAYATIDPKEALEKVDEILELAEGLDDSIEARKGKGSATVVYNTALNLFKESRDPSSIPRAEELFKNMKLKGRADEVSFGTMINLYCSNDGDVSSAEKAEKLVHELRESNLKATTYIMNALINAWVKCGKVRKAKDVLDQIEDSYIASGRQDSELAPTHISYTTLMYGWAKSGDAEKATEVFERMRTMYESGNWQAKPNRISYVTLIDSIIKSNQPEAAERVEKIVRNLYDEYKKGNTDVKPNTHMVTSAIGCWKNSGDRNCGERAEAMLNWLIDIYQNDGDKTFLPSEYTFASTIGAWAKSRKFGKVARARAVLDKMITMYKSGIIVSPPNAICFTAVINSCAYCAKDSFEKRDALKIFVETYKELMDDVTIRPSYVTFSTVLTAIRNLLPPSDKRVAVVNTVFKKCAEFGMCNDAVISKLQSVMCTNDLKELVGAEAVSPEGIVYLEMLPSKWKCNVS